MKHFIDLIFLSSPALAQNTDIVAGVINSFEAGVICAPEVIGSNPAPDTVAGVTNAIAEEPPFVSLGRRVPAVMGVGFGIKAMTSVPTGLSPVTMTITHPAMGKDDVTRQSFATRIAGDNPSLTFYQFDFAYELLPGLWTMEAAFGDTVIYRTSFKVVPPNQIPDLASVCGFEDMLS